MLGRPPSLNTYQRLERAARMKQEERLLFRARAARKRDEVRFLLAVLTPIASTIIDLVKPHHPADEFDPDDNPDEDIIHYAIDLICDDENEPDSLAAAINAGYRDGAEAILPFLERAIQWRLVFE